jgi:hypothetical protein
MRRAPSSIAIRQRIPAVEATSLATEARLTMRRQGVTWLAVRENDVVVGTIDQDQLAPLDPRSDATVAAVMRVALGQVRWLGGSNRLTSPVRHGSALAS